MASSLSRILGSLVRSVHRAELLTMTRFGNADAAELDSDDDYEMTQADYEELRQLTKQQGGRPAATPTKRDVSALAYQEFSRATRESQRERLLKKMPQKAQTWIGKLPIECQSILETPGTFHRGDDTSNIAESGNC